MGAMGLDDLLAPIAVSDFLARHWERAPLLIQPGRPERFADLLNLTDIEALLGSQTFRRPDLRIVHSERKVARGEYMFGDLVDPARLFELFRGGATIIFERLDQRWPPLRRLCRATEQALGHGAQCNVYLTGGRSHGREGESAQGLRRHYDTHDVFVLQLAGTKHWSLFDTAVELPVKAQEPVPERFAQMPVRQTFTLRPGDLLYLPRGLVHEAHATEETSLHITLGIKATTWGDLLAEAVRLATLGDPALRRTLPRVPPGPEPAELAPMLEDALARLGASGALAQAWRSLDASFVNDRMPLLDGQFAQLAALPGLTQESRVAPRATAILRFERREDEIAVMHQRGELAFPLAVEAAVRFALTAPAYRVAQMEGGLDAAGRLVLVRRLVREGLLVIET
jgi:ribosomal protein L16 Arg81 hydroxylase